MMGRDALHPFTSWINDTQLSLAFKTAGWLVPVSQSIHILAIGVVLSSFLMLALRVHGRAAPGVAVRLVNARFLPWVWIAIAVLLVTGLVQMIAEPGRALPNPFFQAKMLMLLAVCGLIGWYQRSVRREPERWDGTAVFPLHVRALFGVVLLLTLGIIFCGRWIAYSGYQA